MMDGIIKADGTSRLMRAELPATYEEFRAQCAAGAQPLDVLFNALGWSQLPTFLNKANLLKDPTAAVFGLGSNPVLDDVFSWIGRYNQHWWSVLHGQASVGWNEVRSDPYYTIQVFQRSAREVFYSDKIAIDESGAVSLVNPQSVTFTNSSGESSRAAFNKLVGKYVKNFMKYNDGTDISSNIYYVSANAAPYYEADGSTVYGIVLYGTRTNPSYTGQVELVTSQAYNIPAGETTYVHSTDRNAYPDSGTVDSLTYPYLGIPFQNAVTAPKIATGSYTGTGTYGASNPCSLTFDFAPKFITFTRFWNGYYTSNLYSSGGSVSDMVFTDGLTTNYAKGFAPHSGEPDTSRAKKSSDGKTISWYNTKSALTQLNEFGYTYYYLAIG